MKRSASVSVFCGLLLAAAFFTHGCGPLPSQGLEHAVTAFDRALLANAFLAEMARPDDEQAMFGVFEGAQVAFLNGYASVCQEGEKIGFPLNIWPASSVETVSCDAANAFTLDIYEDEKDGDMIHAATVALSFEVLEGGNVAMHSVAVLDALGEDNGPPLTEGSTYDLVTEITPEGALVSRTFGPSSSLTFDMHFGGVFTIDYAEGCAAVFGAPECDAGAGTLLQLVAAEVSGGTSGLGAATVTAEGLLCLPSWFNGGPIPGSFQVSIDDVTTDVEYDWDDEKSVQMSFRASNTIDGEEVELTCGVNSDEGEEPGDMIEGDFRIGAQWYVAAGLGSMALNLTVSQGKPMQSSLVFQTYQTATALASEQEEPSLIGLLLLMEGDGDDWCDRDEDGDGVLNCEDPCPNDPDPACVDWCEQDSDNDGIGNCVDYCPHQADPCDDRCYQDDDADGMPNCVDSCPDNPDPNCDWCSQDNDQDGIFNCQDPCPDNPDPACDWCALDSDGDGIFNCQDSCPKNPDPECDWCTLDDDTDGLLNCDDPCPGNPDLACDWCTLDDDQDGTLNCDDPCPHNSDPTCVDWCTLDDDQDGNGNCTDPCPNDPEDACVLPE